MPIPHEPESVRAVSRPPVAGRQLVQGAVLAILFLAASLTVRAQDGPRYVLVLTSFEQQFSPHNAFNAAFRAELTEQLSEPVQFIDVSLPPISPTACEK